MRHTVPQFIVLLAIVLVRCASGAPGSDSERTFAAAESLIRQGKVAEAARICEQIVREKPDFAEAYFALGVSYTQLGRTSEAASALRSYLKLAPQSADAHAALGILLLGDGQVAEAHPQLEEALHLDRAQPEAVKALARVYNVEGKPALSVSLLRPLIESQAADDESRVIFARALVGSGNPGEASAILDKMLARNPQSSIQIYLLGAAARDSHDIQKAIAICERGVQAFPDSERIEGFYVSLPSDALVARANQRLEKLRETPDDVNELIALGRLMTAAGRGKRGPPTVVAKALLERAIELDPQNAAAWYHYGRCFMVAMKAQDALPVFRKALGFAQDDKLKTLILGRIALAEASVGETGAAEADFQKSLALNRKLSTPIPEPALDYYWFLSQSEKIQEARSLLGEILRWEPLLPAARLENARGLEAEKQPRKAIEDAALVIQNTEDPDLLRSAHYLMMQAYRSLGDTAAVRHHVAWLKAHADN